MLSRKPPESILQQKAGHQSGVPSEVTGEKILQPHQSATKHSA